MYSSSMRTARFSGHLGGGTVSAWGGGVCLGGVCLGVSALGGVYTPCQLHAGLHPPPREQND